ncbi:universal stress protein [Streptomyces sp. ID05-04B]|uniref:universal stress protein n=1 Tax=unclassified Streptomyces TaxID=2593676 RepID=UPI000D19F4E2|nr:MULTISPECIES: universal stress protein [unclassified Streptomyces]AVV44706.1 stress-inducible protein [Streptomyces sp. P3]MDX5567401.1 universal stress protein [Streptomyces sp. ID05-04B]
MPAITVGLDGSPESLAAADWAAREATQREAPLRLVHARDALGAPYTPFMGASAPGVLEAQRDWAAHLLREAQSRLTERHPGLRITTLQAEDEAVPALLAAAEDTELLVLGSRGLGTVAGFLVGSVALAVVARTERPVVLVRAGEHAEDEHLPDAAGAASSNTQYRDVVVGLDLEDPGDAVVEFAFETARRRAACLRVVHGWNPAAVYGYGAVLDSGLEAELAAETRQGLSDLLRPWKDKFPGVEVRAQAVVGSAGRHLVHASRDASLVVVGRKRNQALVGGRIGPVTHAVLQHASAPVAVVPHD